MVRACLIIIYPFSNYFPPLKKNINNVPGYFNGEIRVHQNFQYVFISKIFNFLLIVPSLAFDEDVTFSFIQRGLN